MVRLGILILGLGMAGCAARPPQDQKRAVWHMQIGIGHLKKGLIPSALGELLKADELDPNNPVILNNLGLAYYLRGRLDLAESAFRKALRLSPSLTDARNNLGRVLIDQRQFAKAVTELEKAAQDLLYPDPFTVQTNLGSAYFGRGDYRRAIATLERVIKEQRQNCLAWTFFSRALFETGDFERAANAFDTTIRTCKPTAPSEAFYFAALSHVKLGSRERAVTRLEEGLNTWPEGEYALKSRAMLEILR